jgi:hypothetical protein
MAFYKRFTEIFTKGWQNLIGEENPQGQTPAPTEIAHVDNHLKEAMIEKKIEQKTPKLHAEQPQKSAKLEKSEKPAISEKSVKSEKGQKTEKPLKKERTRSKIELKKRDQEKHIEALQKQFTTRKF